MYTYSTIWDADMMEACNCDDGYFGPECTLRSCPSGDDPLTGTASSGDTVQINEQQLVTCQADGGSFVLSFRNAHSVDIPWDADVTAFQAAFEDLLEHVRMFPGVGTTPHPRQQDRRDIMAAETLQPTISTRQQMQAMMNDCV